MKDSFFEKINCINSHKRIRIDLVKLTGLSSAEISDLKSAIVLYNNKEAAMKLLEALVRKNVFGLHFRISAIMDSYLNSRHWLDCKLNNTNPSIKLKLPFKHFSDHGFDVGLRSLIGKSLWRKIMKRCQGIDEKGITLAGSIMDLLIELKTTTGVLKPFKDPYTKDSRYEDVTVEYLQARVSFEKAVLSIYLEAIMAE